MAWGPLSGSQDLNVDLEGRVSEQAREAIWILMETLGLKEIRIPEERLYAFSRGISEKRSSIIVSRNPGDGSVTFSIYDPKGENNE